MTKSDWWVLISAISTGLSWGMVIVAWRAKRQFLKTQEELRVQTERALQYAAMCEKLWADHPVEEKEVRQ